MPASHFLIYYGINSGVRLRGYHADSDAEIAQRLSEPLAPGEAVLQLAYADFPVRNADTISKAIATARGAEPTLAKRHVAVVGGVVVQDGLLFDPTVGTPPATTTYIQHDTAVVGHRWTGSYFRATQAIVDHLGNVSRSINLLAEAPLP